MSQNLLYAAVVIGALRVNIADIFTQPLWYHNFRFLQGDYVGSSLDILE